MAPRVPHWGAPLGEFSSPTTFSDPSIIKASGTDFPSGALVTLLALLSYNAREASANAKKAEFEKTHITDCPLGGRPDLPLW